MLDSKICFVAKSPSYHLGDIRVLKLTSCQQLEHLYDVIVFPTTGKRPHPNEIVRKSNCFELSSILIELIFSGWQ